MVWTYILCVLLAQIFMFLTTDDVSGGDGKRNQAIFLPITMKNLLVGREKNEFQAKSEKNL